MTKDEELDQLRAEKQALYKRLQRKEEELQQSRQANQNIREGLKEAIKAIESLQGHVKTLEGLIDSQQERIKTLEGRQAQDSHNSSLPPSSDRFERPPPRACGRRVTKSPVGNQAIGGTICGKWNHPTKCSFIPSNAVSTASTTSVPNQPKCRSGVK